jgi:citrate synthase
MKSKPSEIAKLKFENGEEIDLPIIKGSYGPSAVDVTKLYAMSDIFTFDPGFMSTASCVSKITYIDGVKGTLMHGGYAISDLAKNCDFLEVVYLLFFGELPNEKQLNDFSKEINNHTLIHEKIHEILQGFTCNAHPMAMIIGLFSSLSAFYYKPDQIYDKSNHEEVYEVCVRSVAKILTIVAACFKKHIGQKFIYPQNHLSYSENFLQMMFGVESTEYKINKKSAKAINAILILHADHEQNASTSTVRLAGSTGANPFACIAAGVASLWGPAHGGANEAVIKMLEEIKDFSKIPDFIEKVKKKEAKLMGFGHRVYKNFDPRASVLKEIADDVMKDFFQNNFDETSCDFQKNEYKKNLQLLEIAKKLEEIALNDEYFISRKLYPNVDFYSGLILKVIGIPTIMFTPIFALARVSGWIAQWKEMVNEGSLKIGRPRQIYSGHPPRDFVKINERR